MKKTFFLLAVLTLGACTPSDVDITPQTFGNPSASIVIEEFSDLQCPACGAISPEVKKIVENNPDLAKLQYYHYPLSQHQYAFVAAEASECAADQGKFWEFVDMVFANQSSLSEDYLNNIAKTLKLNEEAFGTCMDTRAKKGKILAHAREGNLRNVSGTPTLFVNGQLVKWPGTEAFESYLKGL